ncbi:VOC family protein [Solimonas marina]|uniref:Glyoxalase n=1 Tax=Solimonas marina TaxID=2714601 RepID=A0A969W830_9GAMM|nr:VOC family protein [Solimonas marina]NKF22137.1 glyoxalase [Solimonas marina]
MSLAATTRTTIIPTLRYRDAPAAIDWLCSTLGFEQRLVVPGDDGGIAHAQLSFGNGMVMLSSAGDDEWGRRMAQPDEVSGRQTQCSCLIVGDCDAHYAHAVAAGAEIVDPLTAQDYGGKGYACRDPEGHIWWIGSYDPWA